MIPLIAVGEVVTIPTPGGPVKATVYHTTATTVTALVGHYGWWFGKLDQVQREEL